MPACSHELEFWKPNLPLVSTYPCDYFVSFAYTSSLVIN